MKQFSPRAGTRIRALYANVTLSFSIIDRKRAPRVHSLAHWRARAETEVRLIRISMVSEREAEARFNYCTFYSYDGYDEVYNNDKQVDCVLIIAPKVGRGLKRALGSRTGAMFRRGVRALIEILSLTLHVCVYLADSRMVVVVR